MPASYHVWTVCYQCKVFTADGADKLTQTYFVIAETQTEAFQKADNCFSYSKLNKELLAHGEAHDKGISLSNLCKTAHEHRKKIKFPALTLSSDSEHFSLEASLSEDGKTLEYLARKK